MFLICVFLCLFLAWRWLFLCQIHLQEIKHSQTAPKTPKMFLSIWFSLCYPLTLPTLSSLCNLPHPSFLSLSAFFPLSSSSCLWYISTRFTVWEIVWTHLDWGALLSTFISCSRWCWWTWTYAGQQKTCRWETGPCVTNLT